MPINSDNRRYVTAKAVGAGHRFDHLTAPLADQSWRGRVLQIGSVRPPGHSTFGLRSSCDRAELMLAFVTRVAPVSTLAATGSPIEAASAVLTPS